MKKLLIIGTMLLIASALVIAPAFAATGDSLKSGLNKAANDVNKSAKKNDVKGKTEKGVKKIGNEIKKK